ncbi:hypothetical protein AALO_G00221450 [Alosa alosa]|uniref:Transmembrane protein n=1 Tax=Alosa alosa TaxID=278164 RepID=A0AAV6G217_9TELE|nr:hypothetical protein AALO_G00221450 [Alosa alosa]
MTMLSPHNRRQPRRNYVQTCQTICKFNKNICFYYKQQIKMCNSIGTKKNLSIHTQQAVLDLMLLVSIIISTVNKAQCSGPYNLFIVQYTAYNALYYSIQYKSFFLSSSRSSKTLFLIGMPSSGFLCPRTCVLS